MYSLAIHHSFNYCSTFFDVAFFLAATSHLRGPDLKPIDSCVLHSHLMHGHSVIKQNMLLGELLQL